MGMDTGTGPTFQQVMGIGTVRVRDHGYWYGYGNAILHPGTRTVAGMGTRVLQVCVVVTAYIILYINSCYSFWYQLKKDVHSYTLERMRTPVREAESYGIRHVIRHVHCDSMSYDQIRVKPYPVLYRVYFGVAKYGVWYTRQNLSIYAPCPKGRWLHEQNQPIYSYPQYSYISLEEGAASYDIIFPSLPWSPLSVGTSDFHKNAFGKTHVAHFANMTKPGQLWFSDASKDPLGFKFAGGNS